MDFDTFRQKRDECVAWVTANGFNEGDCEKNGEFKVLESLTGHYQIFVDIGANKGIFIDKLNEINPQASVLAFEPNPHLKETLDKKIKNGSLVQAALNNKKGNTTFNIYTADNTTSSLFKRDDMMPHFTKQVEHIDVVLDMLDSYSAFITSLSGGDGVFVKIDAEGAELQ